MDKVELRSVSKTQGDTVGEPPRAENCASHMPLLKVQEPGESNAAIAAVSRGKRFANSNSVGFTPYSGEATAEGTFTTSTSQQTGGPLLPSRPRVVYGF